MPWVVAAAGVGAAATLGASSLQSSAVKKGQDSANARQDAAAARLGVAGGEANTLLQPYQEQGGAAYGVQGDLMGLHGAEAQTAATGAFRSDPGYQFQLSEGLRAIDAGASAKGMLTSGSTTKAEMQFGQGLADQSFQNYYSRLNALASQGYTANAQAGQNLVGAAGGQAQIAGQQAQTDVSAAGTQASIYGNASKGIGNEVNNAANNYYYRQRMNALAPGNSAYNAPGGGFYGTAGTPTGYGAEGYTGQGPYV